MKILNVIILITVSVCAFAQSSWKMVDGKISTAWSAQVDPNKPLPEYPRPQLVRSEWTNLNGLWDYAIKPAQDSTPATYDGKILVPFAIESALSGVGRNVGAEHKLWYKKTLTLPAASKGRNVILHFGAVDWRCEVFINGKSAGKHEGGYDPFSFDITRLLRKGTQEIVVSVWDPSDDGPQPRGKQVKKPHSIWYTPVTGIWQTVWMEAVPSTYIMSTRQVPDIDNNTLQVTALVNNLQPGDKLKVTASRDNKVVAEETWSGMSGTMTIPNAEHWSPANPVLYDLQFTLIRKNKVVDNAKGYFAMRKISIASDNNGIQRMMLNNSFLFHFGPLDQGWWPDGLYTAPTDAALKFDIEKTKEMGFNMIRKHVKVEPARWYYHCDQLGLLVWQDMPSGDMGNQWESRPAIIGKATSKDRTPESEKIFKTEWKAIMDACFNFPSIVVWVPFNEAWGQFKTEEIVKWTMEYDPSRLVNTASGGNFHAVGHIIDMHNYPEPVMPDPEIFGKDRVIVLGEYGGLGLPLEGHTWQGKDNWGYQSFTTKEALLDRYKSFIVRLEPLISKGLSAAVYTQTTDVEVETNGLMTYDRAVIKMPEATLHAEHQRLYNPGLVVIKAEN